MTLSRTARVRAVVAAGALAAGGLAVAVARPASAALPLCNSTAVALAQSATTVYGAVTIPIATSASPRPSCQTGSGSAGSWVRALQRSLRSCNGQAIAVDGIFGPATRQAVRNVQNAASITADGIYGPNTARAMKWYAVADSGATSCRSYSTLGL
jgi:peptidoglycan hydrolase-like protein with peptidoglycan-binding domain